jgi:hypothetical protein
VRRLVLVGVAGVLLAGCGEDPERAAVRGYLEHVNAVQAGQQNALGQADATLKAYAKGTPIDASELLRVEAQILNARDAVAAVTPPARARLVHSRLLHVYDVDAGVAHETLRVVRYQGAAPQALKPLDRASSRLRRELKRAKTSGSQAAALTRFSGTLGRVVARLEGLDVPVLLSPAHRSQVQRLESTRRLTAELRTAVRKKDSRAVAKLLLRFRRGSESRRAQRELSRRGIADYTSLLRGVAAAQADLGRAQADLNRSLR